jgi:hypothetical protein
VWCAACGRSGRYSVKRLLAQRGDLKLTDYLGQITTDCPKRRAGGFQAPVLNFAITREFRPHFGTHSRAIRCASGSDQASSWRPLHRGPWHPDYGLWRLATADGQVNGGSRPNADLSDVCY